MLRLFGKDSVGTCFQCTAAPLFLAAFVHCPRHAPHN